eukprot:1960572-Pyramimonas_sp.AAC.1
MAELAHAALLSGPVAPHVPPEMIQRSPLPEALLCKWLALAARPDLGGAPGGARHLARALAATCPELG